jgi:ABC-type nitrate/sulfonate/bicarbonate transport system permease component
MNSEGGIVVESGDIGSGLSAAVPQGPLDAAERGSGGRWLRAARQALPLVAVLASVVAFWELFIYVTGEPAYVLPPLHQVVFVAITQAPDKLLPAAWVTLQEMLIGFACGVALGLVLGAAIHHSKLIRQGLLPIVIGSQSIPVIAIAPILIIWFGFDMGPKIIMTAVITFFPVAVNTIAGFAAVDPDMINLMRSLDASDWQIFRKVRLPAASPFIFAGVRNSAAISAIGAIVGEWVGADEGLGPVMIAANAGFKTTVVFAAILYLAIMAVALFLAVGLIERVAMPWHFVARQRR